MLVAGAKKKGIEEKRERVPFDDVGGGGRRLEWDERWCLVAATSFVGLVYIVVCGFYITFTTFARLPGDDVLYGVASCVCVAEGFLHTKQPKRQNMFIFIFFSLFIGCWSARLLSFRSQLPLIQQHKHEQREWTRIGWNLEFCVAQLPHIIAHKLVQQCQRKEDQRNKKKTCHFSASKW